MRLEDAIAIDCPSDRLYAVISDLEGHQKSLPGYLESRILEQSTEGCVLLRKAVICGKLRHWKSFVSFEPGKALHFEQLEGPFKGMRVDWELSPVRGQTWFHIVHKVHVRPWWKRWWMEQMIAKPAIEKTARLVLEAIKKSVEMNGSSS